MALGLDVRRYQLRTQSQPFVFTDAQLQFVKTPVLHAVPGTPGAHKTLPNASVIFPHGPGVHPAPGGVVIHHHAM